MSKASLKRARVQGVKLDTLYVKGVVEPDVYYNYLLECERQVIATGTMYKAVGITYNGRVEYEFTGQKEYMGWVSGETTHPYCYHDMEFYLPLKGCVKHWGNVCLYWGVPIEMIRSKIWEDRVVDSIKQIEEEERLDTMDDILKDIEG